MPVHDTKENLGRLRSFKNKGKDSDEIRHRRADEECVESRKAKTDEEMLKLLRNISVESKPTPLSDSSHDQQLTEQSIPEIAMKIFSSDTMVLLEGVRETRELLSKARNPPMDEIIKSGVVPKLVEFLQRSDIHQLQFDSALALTNIASGNSQQTRTVIEAGAVPHLISLLSSPLPNIRDQAVWALGNISVDSSESREYTIRCGIIPPLLACIKPDISVKNLRNVMWTISNLCRHKDPPPSMETIKSLLPMLSQLMVHSDKAVVIDACWALSYITDGSSERIQAVIDAGVTPRLVQLMGSEDTKWVFPSLCTLGNIVSGTDEQRQLVLDYGVLNHFDKLLRHPRTNIQKKAMWTLCNITAGLQSQIQDVIDSGLIPPLVDILIKGEYEPTKEAVRAITNLTAGGTIQQVLYVLQVGSLKPLCDLLEIYSKKTLMVILDAIGNFLNAAKQCNQLEQVCLMIEECEGLEKIENLQEHENSKVCEMVQSIISKFFSKDKEEDASLIPDTIGSNGYQFNPATAQNGVPSDGFSFS